MTNYFDKQGNYINCENLSLAEIYHRAFALGVESVAIDKRLQGDLISREALIKWIDDSVSQYGHTYSTDMLNMWGLFKDYLINNAPTVEPEITNDDLQAAMTESYRLGYELAETKFKRPQGEWDYEQVAFYGVCSNCGVAVTSNLADIFLYEEIGKCPYKINFCPNCGADMRKGGAEND